jgi:hypothetical protein
MKYNFNSTFCLKSREHRVKPTEGSVILWDSFCFPTEPFILYSPGPAVSSYFLYFHHKHKCVSKTFLAKWNEMELCKIVLKKKRKKKGTKFSSSFFSCWIKKKDEAFHPCNSKVLSIWVFLFEKYYSFQFCGFKRLASFSFRFFF